MQKLTEAQQRALTSVRDYGRPDHHLSGASQHGGAYRVRMFLRNYGLIRQLEDQSCELTAHGVAAERAGVFNSWHPYQDKHELKADILALAKAQVSDKLEEYKHELGRGCCSAAWEASLKESIETLELKRRRLDSFKF